MIMAGGRGTRFWPLSRKECPKQFLSIIGQDSLIEATLNRVAPIAPKQQRWILGNVEHSEHLKQLSHLVPLHHILEEPSGQNTAACIGWAAFEALKEDPDAICAILSADAWISPAEAFQETLLAAVEEVKQTNSVVTIGIPPTQPHTGYGYIQATDPTAAVSAVKAFKEKPNAEDALRFLESGDYFWNAGIFVWKASKIIDCLKQFLPNHYATLKHFTDKQLRLPEHIAEYYKTLEPISIDHGVMEHIAHEIKLIKATFQWSDIGSWAALEPFLKQDSAGNAVQGNVVQVESSGNVVVSPKRLVALAHVHDLIVVDSEDAVLILPKEHDQDIKALYTQLTHDYT